MLLWPDVLMSIFKLHDEGSHFENSCRLKVQQLANNVNLRSHWGRAKSSAGRLRHWGHWASLASNPTGLLLCCTFQ